jgi:Transposase and inactivated derivatives
VLKESFRQLCDYASAVWVRKFFDHRRESLNWQRLKPFEELSELIDLRWDGMVLDCKSEPKVALGFVEGINNKIRVIQRRAYGLENPKCFRPKVPTCMLPSLNYRNL